MTPLAQELVVIGQMQALPEHVLLQAGAATIILMAVAWFLFSVFLKKRVFSWLLGGPQKLVLRRLNKDRSEAVFEISGGRGARVSSFEYAVKIATACTKNRHHSRGHTTTTREVEECFFQALPQVADEGCFQAKVLIPTDSLKPASGEYTRITWARLYVFHPWWPVTEIVANENGAFCVQDSVLGETPDITGRKVPMACVEPIDALPSKHSKGVFPTFVLGIIYLFLLSMTVVVPYLALEKKFSLDISKLERLLLDAQIAIIDQTPEAAEKLLMNSWEPGFVDWYGSYEGTKYQSDRDMILIWAKVRQGKQSPEDFERLYSGVPSEQIKAEFLVRQGKPAEAAELLVKTLGYEGEYWRLIPSIMECIRLLDTLSDKGQAAIFAHHLLKSVPDWMKKNHAEKGLNQLMDYCQKNPLPEAETK